ncbi:MAG: tetratricopeptide repeat protein [Pyrinomonadaceae bacterium]|nr:tetratricopeptide repeat protein [Pyrinomonadaceae bacterium]
MRKKPILIVVAALGLVFSGCVAYSTAEEIAPSSYVPADEALAAGEKLFAQRTDLEKAVSAVKTLAKARDPENRDYKLEWKFARYSYFVGSRKETPDALAETVLKKGIEGARIARRMNPNKPDGHFWYAAILGEQSKRSPVTVGVVSVKKIREAMERVIEIDPLYEGASAHDALGQLEMGSRGLAGGSVEKAIKHFEKALALDSNNTYTHLHIGEAYLAADRDADAKRHLENVLKIEPKKGYEAEHKETVEQAKKLLKTKF